MLGAAEGSGDLWEDTGADSLGSRVRVSLSTGGQDRGEARLQGPWHPCGFRAQSPQPPQTVLWPGALEVSMVTGMSPDRGGLAQPL